VKTKRQENTAPAMGQEAEVPDAHEALGKQVQQESAQELIERYSQQLLFIVVSRVAPAKGDFFIRERDEPMIGDRYAMSVTTQIVKHMLWPSEGTFRVDHPVVSEQFSEPGGESLWLSKERQVSVESQPAVAKGALESRNKLAAKDATEHFDGKKEGVASFDPVRVIGGESAGRNHAMDMRVKTEFLIPGVQYAEETDPRAEMSGIASNFQECFRTATKQ
jgi:hypothetical protein